MTNSIFSVFSIQDETGTPMYFSVTRNSVSKRLHDLINGAHNPKAGRQFNQAVSIWLRELNERKVTPEYKIHGEYETSELAHEAKKTLMDANCSALNVKFVNKYNTSAKFKKAQ